MTEAELDIMETLWAKGEPVFLGELLDDFNGERFKRYVPVITREAYLEEATQIFLNKNYGGSCAKMLAMLSGGEKPDENEIEALRQMLKEWEKQ